MEDINDRKKLYNELQDKVDGLGTFEEFDEKLNDEGHRKNLYNALQGNIEGLGTYEEFDAKLKPTAVAPTQAPPTQTTPQVDNTTTTPTVQPTPPAQQPAQAPAQPTAMEQRGYAKMNLDGISMPKSTAKMTKEQKAQWLQEHPDYVNELSSIDQATPTDAQQIANNEVSRWNTLVNEANKYSGMIKNDGTQTADMLPPEFVEAAKKQGYTDKNIMDGWWKMEESQRIHYIQRRYNEIKEELKGINPSLIEDEGSTYSWAGKYLKDKILANTDENAFAALPDEEKFNMMVRNSIASSTEHDGEWATYYTDWQGEKHWCNSLGEIVGSREESMRQNKLIAGNIQGMQRETFWQDIQEPLAELEDRVNERYGEEDRFRGSDYEIRERDRKLLESAKEKGYTAGVVVGELNEAFKDITSGLGKFETGASIFESTDLDTHTRKSLNNIRTIEREYQRALIKGNDLKQFKEFLKGAMYGFVESISDNSNWIDTYNLGKAISTRQLMQKYLKGEKLDQREEDFLRSLAMEASVLQLYADKVGYGYKSGQTTGQSLPFLLSMVGTDGAGILTEFVKCTEKLVPKAAFRWMTRTGLKYLNKGSVKIMSNTAGALIKGAGQTALTGGGKIITGTINRTNAGVSNTDFFGHTDFDQLYYSFPKETSTLRALYKSIQDQYWENTTEYLGDALIEKLTGMGFGAFSKAMKTAFRGDISMRVLHTSGGKYLAGLCSFVDNSKFTNLLRTVKSTTHQNGLLVEYLEEVVNNAANAMFVGDQEWSDVVDFNKNLETVLGLSWTCGAFSLTGATSKFTSYNKCIGKLNESDRSFMNACAGNKELLQYWADFKNSLEGADFNAATKAFKNLHTQLQQSGVNAGQLNRMTNDAYTFLTTNTAINGLMITDAEQKRFDSMRLTPAQVAANDAVEDDQAEGYMATPEERQQLAVTMQAAEANLGNLVDEGSTADETVAKYGSTPSEQLVNIAKSDLPKEDKDKLAQYVQAKNKVEYAEESQAQEVQAKKDEATKEIQSHVNPTTNTIHPVTLNGQQGYITFGDDSAEKPNSEVVFTADDGTLHMVQVKDIVSSMPIGTYDAVATTAEEEISRAHAAIDQQAAAEAQQSQPAQQVTAEEQPVQAGQQVYVEQNGELVPATVTSTGQENTKEGEQTAPEYKVKVEGSEEEQNVQPAQIITAESVQAQQQQQAQAQETLANTPTAIATIEQAEEDTTPTYGDVAHTKNIKTGEIVTGTIEDIVLKQENNVIVPDEYVLKLPSGETITVPADAVRTDRQYEQAQRQARKQAQAQQQAQVQQAETTAQAPAQEETAPVAQTQQEEVPELDPFTFSPQQSTTEAQEIQPTQAIEPAPIEIPDESTIETNEDGSIRYESRPVQETAARLSSMDEEDMNDQISLHKDVASARLEQVKKDVDKLKANKPKASMNIGETQKAREQWKAQVQEAESVLEQAQNDVRYWNDVEQAVNAQRQAQSVAQVAQSQSAPVMSQVQAQGQSASAAPAVAQTANTTQTVAPETGTSQETQSVNAGRNADDIINENKANSNITTTKEGNILANAEQLTPENIERISDETGVSIRDLKRMEALARKINKKLYVANYMIGAKGEALNGLFLGTDGVCISKDSLIHGDSITFFTGHEFTHALANQNKDWLRQFVNYVHKAMGNEAFANDYFNKLPVYSHATFGKQLGDLTGEEFGELRNIVLEEVAADYAGRMMQDPRLLAKMVDVDMSLREKIAAAIDNVIEFFKGYLDNGQTDAMRQCRDMWAGEVNAKNESALWSNYFENTEGRENVQKKNVQDVIGGTIEMEDGDHQERASVSSTFTGAGFEAYREETNTVVDTYMVDGKQVTKSKEVTDRIPLVDEQGNVYIKYGDKVFDGNNPVTAEDLKGVKKSILNFIMADALKYGTITKEQSEKLYQKYAALMNTYLYKGLAQNGGVKAMTENWQWLGDTVYRSVAKNGDDQYGWSIDITKVCKKNEAVIKAISKLQARLGYGITPGQIMDIYLETINQGYQVPCPVCYVFSRYINNGKFASAAINGMLKYGKHLPGQADAWTVEQWEHELEVLSENKEKNKGAIGKATAELKTLLWQIDNLTKKITEGQESGKLSKEEMQGMIDEVHALDARYKAALNVFSQQSLTNWIKCFAIESVDGVNRLRTDTTYPADMDDFKRHALDLTLTSSTMVNYPAIQRLRRSGGSSSGKEITFASNNELGEIICGVKNGDPDHAINYYKMAVEAKTSRERNKWRNQARKRFQAAALYAQKQTLRGGQRMWSWSDNIMRLGGDVAMNLMQMEILGGALQSYSKQLEGIRLVASMNGYVNGSLMGRGIGYVEVDKNNITEEDGRLVTINDITYHDENKNRDVVGTQAGSTVMEIDGKYYALSFDDVVGIQAHGEMVNGKYKKGLFDLNKEYDKAGNILVGMNDNHVRLAMMDPRVFFIIPWHSSGASSHILAQMMKFLGVSLKDWNPIDYTDMQEEKDYGKKKDDGTYPVVPQRLVDLWEEWRNEKDYKCGIKGGIPSGQDGTLSPQQWHYRELRNAIFDGTIDKPENKAWKEEVMNDEFLSQTYDAVVAVDDHKMTTKDKGFIYPYEYWDTTSTYKTADKNAPRYIEYARRLGYKPKFSGRWKEGNTDKNEGNFLRDPGFWKLLIDRRMYDTNGNYQGLDHVDAAGFEGSLIDPADIDKEFIVTQVADDAGAQRIAETVQQTEAERIGGASTVDYNLDMDQAVAAFSQTVAPGKVEYTERASIPTTEEQKEIKGRVQSWMSQKNLSSARTVTDKAIEENNKKIESLSEQIDNLEREKEELKKEQSGLATRKYELKETLTEDEEVKLSESKGKIKSINKSLEALKNTRGKLNAINNESKNSLTIDAVSELFDNTEYYPVCFIDDEWANTIGAKSNTATCSMAYFIDHIINHHDEFDISNYKYLQDVLLHPDKVGHLAGHSSFSFIKYINGKYLICTIRKFDSGKLTFKHFYASNEISQDFVEIKKQSNKIALNYETSRGGDFLITSSNEAGRSLSALDVDAKLQQESSTSKQNRENLSNIERKSVNDQANTVDEYDDNSVKTADEHEAEISQERYSLVTDPDLIAKLDADDYIVAYRTLQLDPKTGNLYPPMAAKVDGEWVDPIQLKQWEQRDAHPEKAIPDIDEKTGKQKVDKETGRLKWLFKLDKGNKKSLNAAYNSYIHSSDVALNDQFMEAQDRPYLVTVEVHIPKSELTGHFYDEKCKDTTGELEWKAGPIQGQLSGTRTVYLSRYDMPWRIVDDAEVAQELYGMFKGKMETLPTNSFTPSLRRELEKLGLNFIQTNNKGELKTGEHKGQQFLWWYGNNAEKARREKYNEFVGRARKAGFTDIIPFSEWTSGKSVLESGITISDKGKISYPKTTKKKASKNRRTERASVSDQAYMDAVNSGDMETAKKIMLQRAIEAMPNTAVVDLDDLPLIVYHGTYEDFNEFKTYGETGIKNTYGEMPSSMFMFTDDDEASDYYGESKPYMLNIEKPLDVTLNGKNKIKEIIREEEGLINEIAPYDWRIDEDNIDEFVDAYVEQDGTIFGDAKKGYLEGANECWVAIQAALEDYAKKNGYDGIIFNDSTRGIPHTTYGVINSSQAKSAVVVTYDDNGEIIPPSQRFDSTKNDTRYSVNTNYIEGEDTRYNDDLQALKERYPEVNRNESIAEDNIKWEDGYFVNHIKKNSGDAELLKNEIKWLEKESKSNARRVKLAEGKAAKLEGTGSYYDEYERGRQLRHAAWAYSYQLACDRLAAKAKELLSKLDVDEEPAGRNIMQELGVNNRGRYTTKQVREWFDMYNKDEDKKELFDLIMKAFEVAGPNITVKFQNRESSNYMGWYDSGTREMAFNLAYLKDVKDDGDDFAHTLLHESIHAVTSYALNLVDFYDHRWKYGQLGKSNLAYAYDRMPKELIEAARTIDRVFKSIGYKYYKDYGGKDKHEMVAELSDRSFRQKLKEQGLWKTLIDGIAMFITYFKEGTQQEKANAYDVVRGALEQMVDNYDQDSANRLSHINDATMQSYFPLERGKEESLLDYASRVNEDNEKRNKERYSIDERPADAEREENESIEHYARRVWQTTKAQRRWDRMHPGLMTDEQARKAVIAEVKHALNAEHVSAIYKNDLTSLLGALNRSNKANLPTMLDEARRIVNHVEIRAMQRRIDDLLNEKVQGVNSKNQSTASGVDDDTRRIFTSLKQLGRNSKIDAVEDKMHALRSENWHLMYDEGQTLTQDEIDTKISENKQKLKDLALEHHRLVIDDVNSSSAGVTKDLQDLEDKFNDPNYNWTNDDAIHKTRLLIQQKLLEGLDARKNVDDQEITLRQLVEKYDSLTEQMNDPNTSQAQAEALAKERAGVSEQIKGMRLIVNQAQADYVDKLKGADEMLTSLYNTGKENLRKEMEDERERRNNILREVMTDITGTGKEFDELTDKEQKEQTEPPLWKTFFSPLRSFEYEASKVGQRTFGKDSNFYNRFVKGKDGILAAGDKFVTGMRGVMETLNNKCMEIYGVDFEHAWRNNKNKKCTIPRTLWVKGVPYRTECEMSIDTAMYLHMLWKMKDGQGKLLNMGFDENSMDVIVSAIGYNNNEFAEWVQEEFLKDMRQPYNEVYKNIFHTSMAEIDHYFPIKTDANQRRPDTGLEPTGAKKETLNVKVGSTINRVPNITPIDLSRGAFDVLFDHVNEVEEFMAFAPVRRDLNWVLGSTYIKNKMNANNRGSYKRLCDAAAVACRVKVEEVTSLDKLLNYIQKGLVGGNIAFRNTTALKQILSVPAYLGYSQDRRFLSAFLWNMGVQYTTNAPALLKNMITFGYAGERLFNSRSKQDGMIPLGLSRTIGWCLNNVPDFYDRVTKGTAGMNHMSKEELHEVFKDKIADLVSTGMASNQMVDAITVAIGIKTIYDYRMARFKDVATKQGKELGYEGEALDNFVSKWMEQNECHNRSVMEAELYFNSTQQSNNPAFLSPFQTNRGFVHKMFTLYKNSPTGYARQLSQSLNELGSLVHPKKLANMAEEYAKRMYIDSMAQEYLRNHPDATITEAIPAVTNEYNENVKALAEQRSADEGLIYSEAFDAVEQELIAPYKGKAREKIARRMGKAAFNAFLYGFVMNDIWNIGGQGFLGFCTGLSIVPLLLTGGAGGSGDDDYPTTEEELTYLMSLPGNGIIGPDALNSLLKPIINGDKRNVSGIAESVLGAEINKSLRDFMDICDKSGFISKQMAWYLVGRIGRFSGLNPVILTNTYLGIERMCRHGWHDGDELVIDLMLLLQSPESNRVAVAKQLFKDRPIDEYITSVKRAAKYLDEDCPTDWEGFITGEREMTAKAENAMYDDYIDMNRSNDEANEEESWNKKKQDAQNVATVEDAVKMYDEETDPRIKEIIAKRITKLATEEKKTKTPQEKLKARKELKYGPEGVKEEKDKGKEKYKQVRTGKDVLNDALLAAKINKLRKVWDTAKSITDPDKRADYFEKHADELAEFKKLSGDKSAINKVIKSMQIAGDDTGDLMNTIRDIRDADTAGKRLEEDAARDKYESEQDAMIQDLQNQQYEEYGDESDDEEY